MLAYRQYYIIFVFIRVCFKTETSYSFYFYQFNSTCNLVRTVRVAHKFSCFASVVTH